MSDGTYCERCGDQMAYRCFGCDSADSSKELSDIMESRDEWKRRALAAEGVIAAVARGVPYLPPLNMREDRSPEHLRDDGDVLCVGCGLRLGDMGYCDICDNDEESQP